VTYPVEQVRLAFVRLGLFAAYGPLAALFVRTVETGQPWVSDFGYWMRGQPPAAAENLERAVASYMAQHGPGRWAFAPE
jgi:hypothetical protein